MEHENTARTVSSMAGADPRPQFTPRQADQFGIALGRLLFARNRWHEKPTHKRYAALQSAQAGLTNLLRSIMADQVTQTVNRHLFEWESLTTDADDERRQAAAQPSPDADIPEIDRLAKAARNAEIAAARARADYAKAGIDAETALDIADLREHWEREVESKVQDPPAHPCGIPADQPPPIDNGRRPGGLLERRGVWVTPDQAVALDAAEEMAVRNLDLGDGLQYADDIDDIIEEAKTKAFNATMKGLAAQAIRDQVAAPAGKFDVVCPRCNTTNRYPGGFPAGKCGQCGADLSDVTPFTPPPPIDAVARRAIVARGRDLKAKHPLWRPEMIFDNVRTELQAARRGDNPPEPNFWTELLADDAIAAAHDAVEWIGPNVLLDPDKPTLTPDRVARDGLARRTPTARGGVFETVTLVDSADALTPEERALADEQYGAVGKFSTRSAGAIIEERARRAIADQVCAVFRRAASKGLEFVADSERNELIADLRAALDFRGDGTREPAGKWTEPLGMPELQYALDVLGSWDWSNGERSPARSVDQILVARWEAIKAERPDWTPDAIEERILAELQSALTAPKVSSVVKGWTNEFATVANIAAAIDRVKTGLTARFASNPPANQT